MKRAAILAVDAGGSKSDAVLLSRGGAVLGAARARASEPMGSGTHLVYPSLAEDHLGAVGIAIARAAREVGLDPGRAPVADLGVYCLAGADLPADDRRLMAWLHSNGWASEDVLRNDTFAVLRAGTDRGWGVAIVCGQGTNCTGISPDGRVYRLPAVGPVSGDWGGGVDIGGAALWHAIRATDGRGARTRLTTLVPTYFGMRRPRQVMEALYFGKLPEERVVELTPLVFRAASDGDRVARGIVDRQADEIVTMAGAAIRRLRMTRLDVDVVLGGGIFRNRDECFFDRIREGLVEVAPRAQILVLTVPPVIGAALIGMDRLGAGRAAKAKIRAGLTHARLTAHTRGRKRER